MLKSDENREKFAIFFGHKCTFTTAETKAPQVKAYLESLADVENLGNGKYYVPARLREEVLDKITRISVLL